MPILTAPAASKSNPTGETVWPPRTLYWEHEGNRAIRDDDWKLVASRDAAWELYRIDQDRTELEDLSDVHPEVVAELQGKWQRWANQVGVLTPEQFETARRSARRKTDAGSPTDEPKKTEASSSDGPSDSGDLGTDTGHRSTEATDNTKDANALYLFNRSPLAVKPYSELPLGTIRPEGWLRDELTRMAGGMTGNLDRWYPEVCGPRNAWLGGDGDTWERGPYWIDGLYPLAKLLDDADLQAKAQAWIEWTLANQREDGYIGPRPIDAADRSKPPPDGAQVIKPDDWWPRMVMLKILQQHYLATKDRRVIDCLDKYFQYQLRTLPQAPLHEPSNPRGGSWWAAQRGGDNLMSVLWMYNVTGKSYLLELADLINRQTIPVTEWLSEGPQNMIRRRADQGDALHCVNLAQMMKTPVVRWQQDRQQRHLEAIETAFRDIRTFHGQPSGLYGGDEGMHGDSPDRGSELCSAVEMMFSLEKMFEITGNPVHGDRLEKIAFNALPTQCTDDHHARQYFQQTNQVQCTLGERDFFNDNGDRVVYGLLDGYPCCTCNLHQGWPKFAQHAWLASRDGGLAILSYLPTRVTANVADGQTVSLRIHEGYPFHEHTRITVDTAKPVPFPLHLRIPSWASGSEMKINGKATDRQLDSGSMQIVRRTWHNGDTIELKFPMPLRSTKWYARSKAIERGPLVFALPIETQWRETVEPGPPGTPKSAMHRGYREAFPLSAWNYALPGPLANRPEGKFRVWVGESIPPNPWSPETAPVRLTGTGIRLPSWTIHRNSAAPPPLSPTSMPENAVQEEISLIPYGATTLRVTAFPWIRREDISRQRFDKSDLRFESASASFTHPNDTPDAVRMPHQPRSSADPVPQRWTSWPQQGQSQWLEICLKRPTQINRIGVYWFDDHQGIDLPASWEVQIPDEQGWKPIRLRESSKGYPIDADRVCEIQPSDLTTDRFRIVMSPSGPNHCVGILRVDVNGVD